MSTSTSHCSYFMCKNRNVRMSMFRFPRDEKRMRIWLEHCGNMTLTHLDPDKLRNRYICIDHFDDKYIRNREGCRIRLQKGAVPKVYNEFEIPEPNSSEIPGRLKVLPPTRVYQNRKEREVPTDYFQWKRISRMQETKRGCDLPKYISYKALLDQTKIVIAKVYHYFEQEYEELKKSFDGLEQTPLSKFRQRTALATGVSESTVAQILQEEERREQREETSRSESLARKRPRQTNTSSDDDTDSVADDDEPPSAVQEEDMLVVKEEPVESCNEEPEIYMDLPEVKAEPGVFGANDALADPISVDFKTEPQDEEATTEEKRKELKRKKTNARQRAYYHRQKELKKNAKIKKVPKSNAERQRNFRQRNAEKSYMNISNETVVTQRIIKSIKGRNTKRSAVAPASASVPTNAPPTTSKANAPPATSRTNAPSAAATANAPPASPNIDAPPAQPRRQLLLLDDGDIKMEQIDIEEGFS